MTPVRQRLTLAAIAVALPLAAATWVAFSTIHSNHILLRDLQAHRRPLNQLASERLTQAAIASFELQEQQEALALLSRHPDSNLKVVALLEAMVGRYPARALLRLRFADALAHNGQRVRAREQYEYLLGQIEES